MGVANETRPEDTKSTCALLVIDMQLVAFDGIVTPPIVDGSHLLKSVSRLIDGCRGHGIPIVYLQTAAAAGHPYAGNVHGWEIHPQISRHGDDHVVTKQHSSGFDDTNLAEVLGGLGIGMVVLCGIWSEHCVANTSLDALRLGFRAVAAGDGHGTVAPTVGEAGQVVCQLNRRLEEAGASVCRVSELLSQEAVSLPGLGSSLTREP